MKKMLPVLGALALMGASALFFSCDGIVDGDEINNYATTTVDAVSFTTAKAYPGVNVLKWNAVKDVSSYTVYRTVKGGQLESVVSASQTALYYVDTDIEEGTTYTYRIVSEPSLNLLRDESEKSVTLTTAKTATGTSLKGTWAPENTVFSDLAQYESDYNASSEVLSADTISVKLVKSTGNTVRASFPVKPYAKYTVYLSQVNGGLVNSSASRDSSVTISGFDYDGTASVDLTAVYAGEKQVTVVAKPLNSTLYGQSIIASTATVTVAEDTEISSAVKGSVSAKWTNYSSSTNVATARVYFSPAVFNGEEFDVSEYTVYRALYDSDGETLSVTDTDGTSTSYRTYTSIVSLGSPSKDVDKSTSDSTVYYVDDTAIDLSAANDIAGARFYVVLNHNGTFKSTNTLLTVPDSSDSDWNFTPDSEYTVTNSIAISDLYLDSDGKAQITAAVKYSAVVNASYGAFDTKNEALTAVNSELPTAISGSVSYGYDTADNAGYYWKSAASTAVTEGKYYAFRFVSSYSDADDAVAVFVAEACKEGDAWYWNVVSGYEPENYVAVGSPSLTLTTTAETTNYESVTLSYSASNAVRYVLDRTVNYSSSSSWPKTLSSTSYTDSTVSAYTLEDDTIRYTLTAVGYYGKASTTKTVSSLATPAVSYDSTTGTITWDAVTGATRYYIYCAKTEEELAALSDYTTTSTTGTSYSVTASSFSDYYYAVKAYRSSDYVYSSFSDVITVEKEGTDLDFYSYYNGTYTWRLSWNREPNYTSIYYYILRYETTDASVTEDDVLADFEASPDTYRYASASSTYYDVTNSGSSRVFYAVATRAYDSSYNYYTIGDVYEVENALSGVDIQVAGSSGAWELSWDAFEGAASYNVYEYGSTSSYTTMYASTLANLTPVGVINPSYTSNASRSYNYFLVVALDSAGNRVGMTNIAVAH